MKVKVNVQQGSANTAVSIFLQTHLSIFFNTLKNEGVYEFIRPKTGSCKQVQSQATDMFPILPLNLLLRWYQTKKL